MMKKIGILYHPLKEAAHTLSGELRDYLDSQGFSAWVCSAWDDKAAREKLDGTDLVLAIGGDGTILRAMQVVLPHPIPLTGINMGRLGFMTELSTGEVKEKLPVLLAGNGWLDERRLFQAELVPGGDREKAQTFHALNDIVVARGVAARAIYVEVSIDGKPLTGYNADGVIVATATGSTGYALAVGGPVLHPQSKDMVLAPIAPHLSLRYPLVLPPASTVQLLLTTHHPAVLSVDGHINLPLTNETTVTVRHSPQTIRFLRIHREDSFWTSLEDKLKGKK